MTAEEKLWVMQRHLRQKYAHALVPAAERLLGMAKASENREAVDLTYRLLHWAARETIKHKLRRP